MRDKTYHAYLDSHERQLVIHSLVELKNRLIQEGRYTDCVDELIFKVVNAPVTQIFSDTTVCIYSCFRVCISYLTLFYISREKVTKNYAEYH